MALLLGREGRQGDQRGCSEAVRGNAEMDMETEGCRKRSLRGCRKERRSEDAMASGLCAQVCISHQERWTAPGSPTSQLTGTKCLRFPPLPLCAHLTTEQAFLSSSFLQSLREPNKFWSLSCWDLFKSPLNMTKKKKKSQLQPNLPLSFVSVS